MFEVKYTTRFEKDLKKVKSQGKNLKKLKIVIDKLIENKKLDLKYKDHLLVGDYVGFRECHIEPDWLLVYKYENDILILVLQRTGSHSDLFK